MNETPSAWIQELERLGYAVTRRDPLLAHKTFGTRLSISIDLDPSGQIRMVTTRQEGDTRSAVRQSRSGRRYQVFAENQSITIVSYQLREGDDLAPVLAEMEKEIGPQGTVSKH